MSDNPLSTIGELSKPATVLIEKVSAAVGAVFEPHQRIRLAKADAKTAVIRANAEIEVTDIQRRAMQRMLDEETRHQANIESIVAQAIPDLDVGSNPSTMSDDWLANFFEQNRTVSDPEMQSLWARILAGEANTSGTFSKRTVNLLGDMEKSDAEAFSTLCNFLWQIGPLTVVVFELNDPIYVDNGLTFDRLTHLESLGLIRMETAFGGFLRFGLPETLMAGCGSESFFITLPPEKEGKIEIGKVLLTLAGSQLAGICKAKAPTGFADYAIKKWAEKAIKVERIFTVDMPL